MERSSAGYSIKLPHFEGPFDLLLFFIERDELDIYDIPIARITNDFLEYIRSAQTTDIDLAGEFILVAAEIVLCGSKRFGAGVEIVGDVGVGQGRVLGVLTLRPVVDITPYSTGILRD